MNSYKSGKLVSQILAVKNMLGMILTQIIASE